MQLTQAQAERLFVPLIALTMSGLMSLFMTAVNVGLNLRLLALWPQQWLVAFAVALPTALLVVPRIRNGLARVTVPSSALRSSSPPRQGGEPVTRASDRGESRPQAAASVPLPATRGEGGTNGGAVGGVRAFRAPDRKLSGALH